MEKEGVPVWTALAVCLLLGVPCAAAQDRRPPAPGRRVHIQITERFRGDKPDPRYTQPRTVRVKTPAGEVAVDSQCEWIPREREVSLAPPSTAPVGPFTLRVAGSPIRFDVDTTRWPDPDLAETPYTSGSPGPAPPPGGSPVTAAPSGANDGGLLYGPDLDLELGPGLTDWISADVDGHLYARGLFGDLELAGIETGVRMVSVGGRLRAAFLAAGPFEASAHLSGGPCWLITDDLGGATGIEAAAGLEGEIRVSRTVHLTAGVEAHGFWSEGLRGWGPALLMGLNLGW